MPKFDSDRIPRRPDAEAVDLPAGKAVHHIGRRQHDEPHIFVRIDAARRHPEAEQVVVAGERKGHAEGEGIGASLAPLGDDAGQRPRRVFRIGHVAVGSRSEVAIERGRYGDRVAVHAEHERHQSGNLMCPMPRLEAIASGASKCAASNRPILSLSRTFDHDTSRTRSSASPCCAAKPLSAATISAAASASGMKPIRRRVAAHFSSSAAVTTDCATSAIFLFSFIAVLRSIA